MYNTPRTVSVNFLFCHLVILTDHWTLGHGMKRQDNVEKVILLFLFRNGDNKELGQMLIAFLFKTLKNHKMKYLNVVYGC